MSLSRKKWFGLFVVLLLLVTPGLAQRNKKKKEEKPEEDPSKLKAATFAGLKMRGIGPALMSGRIADIVIHPHDQSVWYVGVGSGGVWKTTNAGTTWASIFDGQGSYSIGCIALDPNQPNTVWVGSGENVGGRHVAYGDGVYRSLDGGKTWKNMGLKASNHIGTILIHPEDSNTIYVASQGPLWSSGGDRGLFKSVDGGATWEKILGGGEYTGVNEVRMDPRNPDVLYASTHQRYRTVAALINGGPESGIHKSVDGGKTWRKLKTGLPGKDMGKIGLTISPQNPDVIYATIELAWREGGFYRSANGGETWEKRSDYLSGGTGPHYYQEIFASPHKFDRIYQMDVRLHVSEDGGKTFVQVGERNKHGDNHAMAFDPKDPNYLIVGSDGGVYESWDLGKHWKFIANLPITQFYKVAVDYDEPFYNLYGGTQDNNTQGGPSRTDNVSGIRNSDWFITLFGDGHQPAVDYSNPDIVYSEWQEGNLVRYDRKTGEIVYIQPQPGPDDPAERFNWDAPILISAHDPARIYFASQRVWRSNDRGDAWTSISGDLTRNQDRIAMPMMHGRVWSVDAIWDLWAMSNFSTITSLAESPIDENILYAGTDDGLLQVTEDGGANWRQIEVSSLPGVPANAFINDVKADLHDANSVYVVLDNHKTGDFKPYVVKSSNRGATWTNMAGDLPDRHLTWRIVQDHEKPELFFIGTEFGVFFTLDAGGKWIKLTGNAPTISFRDLAIQKRENDLVGATFGRSFYILDDYSPLRTVTEELLEKEAHLFGVKDPWWYIPKRPLGRGAKATQGDGFYNAPNPPFGAVFTYYLSENLQTAKQKRQADEKKLIKEEKDAPYPGWDALRAEEKEDEPRIILTVLDGDGNTVTHIGGPVKKGFHRVAWDLRYPSTQAVTRNAGGGFFGNGGWLAPPGNYSVIMSKMVDGQVIALAGPETFEVKQMRTGTLEGASHDDRTEFLIKVGKLQGSFSAANAAVGELNTKVSAMKTAIMGSQVPDASLYAEALDIEKQLYDLTDRLQGHQLKGKLGEPAKHAIGQRMQNIMIGNLFSTYGPTPTHQMSYDIAVSELTRVRTSLNNLIGEVIPDLEKRLEAAGVPWTSGRLVPEPQ